MRTFDDFDQWCRTKGLVRHRERAAALSVSCARMYHWKRTGRVPAWLPVVCLGYARRPDAVGSQQGPVHAAAFREWLTAKGIGSTERFSTLLGYSRQAVDYWIQKERFPAWLPHAMRGMEATFEVDLRSQNIFQDIALKSTDNLVELDNT